MRTEWRSWVFTQAEETTGQSRRVRQPEVPIGTPGGISYVPNGPDYEVSETVNVGLTPLEQFVDFLNQHGDEITSWTIVDGTHSSRRLPVLYEIAVSS